MFAHSVTIPKILMGNEGHRDTKTGFKRNVG